MSGEQGLALFRNGQGGNVYQGQRVGDLGNASLSAINHLGQAADLFKGTALKELANGPMASTGNLAQMAKGEMIGNNARFGQALQNTLDNTATTINSSLSGAGRYGSGAHSGVMADQLGQVASGAMANQYNQDVQNMLTANGQIDQANLGRLNALGNLFQSYSNVAGNALAGGQVIDRNQQARLDAERDRWLESDNQGWTRLGLLQNAMAGAASTYGTTRGNQNSSSKGFNLLSDRRAKENIVPLGERDGFQLYEWNYRGDAQRYRGVMAQDLLHSHPEAVSLDEDGFYRVDYSRLGFAMEVL